MHVLSDSEFEAEHTFLYRSAIPGRGIKAVLPSKKTKTVFTPFKLSTKRSM